MPRNGSGVYSLPGDYEATAGETILASQHNSPLEDLEQDMNTVRPVVAGGTGVDSAIEAFDAFFAASSNIASATTTDLSTATGPYVTITGTTTITGFGTLAAGNIRLLKFTGVLTLTHNATSLILPTGASVITTAGDIALAISEGGGNWRVQFIRGTAMLARGVDLATAATLNLDSVDAPCVALTGTTTVTAVTLTSRRWRICRADAAFQITAGASLIVNGSTSVNFTTVANDLLLFEGYGSSVVRVWVIGRGPTALLPAIGTANQLLRVNSGATGLEYGGAITLGTAQASTSGSSIDFTSIPSWAKKITVTFVGVSSNGTANPVIQIGDSGGLETSGYLGSSVLHAAGAGSTVTRYTTGFGIASGSGNNIYHGAITLTLHNAAAFTWVASGSLGLSSSDNAITTNGSKSLSAALDRLSIVTTDTWDAGSINIAYE